MLESLVNLFLSTVWLLLHLVYHLVINWLDQVGWVFKRIREYSFSSQHYLHQAASLPKRPTHLGIVVCGKEPPGPFQSFWINARSVFNFPTTREQVTLSLGQDIDLHKLAQVMSWAWVSGVGVISLYDRSGLIKSRSSQLWQYLYLECGNPNVHLSSRKTSPGVHFHHVLNKQKQNGLKTNGHVHVEETSNGKGTDEFFPENDALHVWFFSKKDGREAIVQTCKRLHKEQEITIGKMEDISEGRIEDKLNQVIHLDSSPKTEPDLLWVMGNRIPSTMGFLPWHIRLTEIHWQPPLSRMTKIDFINSLSKYATCHQRFGK